MAKKEGIFKKIGAGIKARRKRRKEKKITKLGTQYSMTKPAKAKVTTVAVKDKSELDPKGRIRKGAQSVKVTKGGAYATYGKKSKAAGSFRSSFAEARKAGKKTFKWDGRSYSTAVAKPAAKKAAPKPAAKRSRLEETRFERDTNRMAARENRSAKKAAAVPATNPKLEATRETRKKKAAARAKKKTLFPNLKVGNKNYVKKAAKGGMVGDSIKTYGNGGYVEGE
tara:strand:+ start:48 stop:722 length:675 start_codon:yes stop_codon:yes gene_type:complete